MEDVGQCELTLSDSFKPIEVELALKGGELRLTKPSARMNG